MFVYKYIFLIKLYVVTNFIVEILRPYKKGLEKID